MESFEVARLTDPGEGRHCVRAEDLTQHAAAVVAVVDVVEQITEYDECVRLDSDPAKPKYNARTPDTIWTRLCGA